MSNVLIGIIGVILFIGLALAGALFLGPRFQSATVDAKASSVMAAVGQAADAVNMHNLQEGASLQSGNVISTLATKGYLKAVPVNAVEPTWSYDFRDAAGGSDGSKPAAYADTGLPLGEISEKVCESINRQSGVALVNGKVPFSNTNPPSTVQGCFRTVSWGSIPFEMFLVYRRI